MSAVDIQNASEVIETKHKEFVHSIAFNYYGDRLATCGSDQTIKVWDRSPDGKNWTLSKQFPAHSGPIWQVKWADPQFGNVIGSCSFDRTVMIWEERQKDTKSKYWKQMANIREFKQSVTDIDFAPRDLGLVLAACSEGKIKIFEVYLVNQNTYKHLGSEIEISARGKLSAICWNPSGEPLFAVSCEQPEDQIVDQSGEKRGTNVLEVILRRKDKWKPGGIIKKQPHNGGITSVTWAHSLGRSFHLLATGDEYGVVALWRGSLSDKDTDVAKFSLHAFCVIDVYSDLQKQRVWKVGFNLMGSVLFVTGENSVTKIWQLNKHSIDPQDWDLELLGDFSLSP